MTRIDEQPPVRLGIDTLLDDEIHRIRGRRLGLVTSAASVDRRLRRTIDRLVQTPDINVTALFAPEHGLYAQAQAGASVPQSIDHPTGLTVYSLYGEYKQPPRRWLNAVDVIIVDLVDAGSRYWTFPYTMAHVLQACADSNLEVIVLDRPNPITGQYVEGNLLNPQFSSFVGLYPIPMRTGLTIGELARLFNETFQINASLTVIPLQGWTRSMWYDETGLPFVPPTPNAPSLDTFTLYPGTCLLEGSNVSEGRGTTRPFEIVGAPWIDPHHLADRLNERALPGVLFRPVYFTPTFHKYVGQTCGGVHIHIVDRAVVHAVQTGLHVIDGIIKENPDEFQWMTSTSEIPFIDLLAGTDELRLRLGLNDRPDDLIHRWERRLPDFERTSRKIRIY